MSEFSDFLYEKEGTDIYEDVILYLFRKSGLRLRILSKNQWSALWMEFRTERILIRCTGMILWSMRIIKYGSSK